MYYVYKITNKINNKIYIGKTNNLKRRFYEHLHDAYNKNRYEYNSKLGRSIRKYGKNNFYYDVLSISENEKSIYEAEKIYIRITNSIKCGLNIGEGGEGFFSGVINPMHNVDLRNKFSENRKGVGNPSAILNDEKVLFIKQMIINDEKLSNIGKLFQISTKAISDIKLGKRWSHIKPETILLSSNRIGSSNGMSKLNEEEVKEIKKLLLANSLNQTQIAKLFGVSKSAISDIKYQRRWKHIKI